MRWDRDNFVQISSAPARRHMASAAVGAETGKATVRPVRGEAPRRPRRDPQHQRQQDHQAFAVVEDAAVVVDQRDPFAVGAEDGAEVGARRPHQRRHPPGVLEAVESHRAPGGGVRVDGQDLGPELAEDGGHDERRRPEGVVQDHLEACRPDGVGVDVVEQGLGVEVGDARRVDDVARLRGQAPAEVLPVEDALDLALGHLGDVDAAGVEEAQDDGLGVLIGQADGHPPGTVLVAHGEAGDRHGGHFEVDDVDAGGVEAHGHGLLQHPGGTAGVPGDGDGGAPGHARSEGHGQAQRQFRRDVDVGQARDPVAAEQVARPRDSQTIDELTMAPCSTVLNGKTFTPACTTACSPMKHSSPSTTPSSIRAPRRSSLLRPTVQPRQPDAGAQIGVVVHHGALDEGVGPDPDIAA